MRYHYEVMLLLAHTGITVGIIWLTQKSSIRFRAGNLPLGSGVMPILDYRLLLVGSMLPDIIDKPLGIWLLRETVSNGRVFGHTLLFAAVLVGVGLYLYKARKKVGILCLALGTLAHFALDQMWLNLHTLLWPLFGFSFERQIVEDWLSGIISSLATEPKVYLPELFSGLVLVWFFWDIMRRGRLTYFLRSGRLN